MSRQKQPRITIAKEESPLPEVKPETCLNVKVCTVCNGYAFSVFQNDKMETVCPCGLNRETIQTKLPMTMANLQEIRSAYEELVKK